MALMLLQAPDETQKWYCKNSSDKKYNKCSVPQVQLMTYPLRHASAPTHTLSPKLTLCVLCFCDSFFLQQMSDEAIDKELAEGAALATQHNAQLAASGGMCLLLLVEGIEVMSE